VKHVFRMLEAGPGRSYARLLDQRSCEGALRLVGAVEWPVDPFFRPTIGVFSGQKLIAVIPTYRRPIEGRHGAAAWVCAFEHVLSTDLVEAVNLAVCCFETGETLGPESGREAGLSAPSLLAEKTSSAVAQNGQILESGFPTFLTLPWRKQIDLIYVSTLERRADKAGVATYHSFLVSGGWSILDIRDALLTSEEYMRRSARGAWHIRNWLVWPGLTRLPKSGLQGVPVDAMRSCLELPISRELPESLASNALGDQADGDLIRRWTIEHAPEIAAVIESLKTLGRLEHRAGMPRFRGLLAAMRPGEAGSREATGRDQAVIASRPDRHGLLTSGPNIALRPGNYRGVVIARVDGRWDGASHLGIEATYKSTCLGRSDFTGETLNQSSFAVPFSAPPGQAELLAKALFEIKVSWNGPGRVTLNDVSIEPDSADGAPEPIEWLPGMSIAQGVDRVKSPWSVSAPPGLNGNFLYGPYRGLLPGVYVLSCHCDVRSAPGDRDQISIAIAASRQQPFSRQSFTVSVGRNILNHVFEIPEEPDRLPSDIEFRIAKRAGVDVTVNRLQTRLAGST